MADEPPKEQAPPPIQFGDSPLTVSPGAPFAEDKLGRQAAGDKLQQIVTRAKTPFTLAINGAWGTGKTEFLRMWRQQLEDSDATVVGLNAWATDFSGDPFISLATEMRTELQRILPPAKARILGKRMGAVLRPAIPVAVRLAVKTAALAAEVPPSAVDALTAGAQSVAAERMDRHKEASESVARLRKELAGVPKSARADRIICLIDELDRCRPTCAIELLENLKHVFGVEGWVFVLAVDKSQLATSIRTVYGSKTDAGAYLRRFFNLEFDLGLPPAQQYYTALFDRWSMSDLWPKTSEPKQEQDAARDVAAGLSDVFRLSLRDIQSALGRLAISLTSAKPFPVYATLVSGLTTLSVARPEIYRAFLDLEAGAPEVLGAIREMPTGEEFLARPSGVDFRVYLEYCQSKAPPSPDPVQAWADVEADDSAPPDARRQAGDLRQRFDFIREYAAMRDRSNPIGCLDVIRPRLELIEHLRR